MGFEADAYDAATETGWSVLVSGLAEIVEDEADAARLAELGLRSWGGGAAETVWVRIRPTSISGGASRLPRQAAADPQPAGGWWVAR